MGIRYEDLTRNLTYVCAHSPRLESFRDAIELIEREGFDPSTIFSHEVPFREFADAYRMASEYADGVVKILLWFPDEEGCNGS